MRGFNQKWTWVGTVLFLAAISGAAPAADGPSRKDFLEAGKALDRLTRDLEEYGSITMSSPILAKPDGTFDFGLNRKAEDYFKDNKEEFQAAAAARELSFQSFSGGL